MELEEPVFSKESSFEPGNNLENLVVSSNRKKAQIMLERPVIPEMVIDDLEETVISRESPAYLGLNMENLAVTGT